MVMDGAGEKAVIYVYLTDISKKTEVVDEAKKIKDFEQKLRDDAKQKVGIGKDLKDGIVNTASDVWNAVKPGGNSSDKIAELVPGKTDFAKFTVQYNPATIRLSSVNGRVQSRKADEGIDGLKMYKFTGKSKLSFDLIFDDCDNMNAFMLNDVANVNVSSALKKGYHALNHKGTDYSVRKRMDAIMSLLTDIRVQQVIFFWSNMCFRGTVTDVGNTFTMFNPKGNPIRGEMHLELTQDKKRKDDLLYDNKYWREAFKKIFKESKRDDIDMEYNGSSAASQVFNGSFLNLSL